MTQDTGEGSNLSVQDNRKTPDKGLLDFVFWSNTFLFAGYWVHVLAFAYHHWPALSGDAIAFVIGYPFPWIVMLRARRNYEVLMMGVFAYLLLAVAVGISHL
jgi:hypothetical protein